MQLLRKTFLVLAIVSGLIALGTWLFSRGEIAQPALVIGVVALAIGLAASPALKTYQFTAWMVAAVLAAIIYPQWLAWLSPDQTALSALSPAEIARNKTIMMLVIQSVMFGMGTQMKLRDFAFQGHMSYGVLIGMILQFSIMPLVGFAIGKLFRFPAEIAAGMVLIGSCPSGLASNVMTYLAKGNLALSVTVTAMGTLIAPLMTPLWMKTLAGEMVDVNFVKMMLFIIKIVVVPIGAALLHDFLKHASPLGRRIILAIALLGALWLAFIALGGWAFITAHTGDTAQLVITLFGFLCAAIIAGVLYNAVSTRWPAVSHFMPKISMFGIIYFTAVTTSAGRDELVNIGLILLLAVVIHNSIGYLLGYWLSRGFGLDINSARTIALEVGIHNGGLTSGIASDLGKLATVGLPAALFSPWMNVSGSILANYWRKRPQTSDSAPPSSAAEHAKESATNQ